MNITIDCQTNPSTLANASLIFLERKPIMRLAVYGLNALFTLLFIVILAKAIIIDLPTLQEALACLVAISWVLGRRPATLYLLTRKMTKNPVYTKPLKVTATMNGIIWSGEGLKPGNISWQYLKIMYRVRNGFILPVTPARFLWLPFSGFQDGERSQFENYCMTLNIKIVRIKKPC